MIPETWPSLVVNLELKTKLLSQKAKGTWNTGRNYTEKKISQYFSVCTVIRELTKA